MSISSYLAELADVENEISSAGLTQLSGVFGPDELELEEAWDGIPPERRLEVVDNLLQLSEDNVDLDFYAVFCNALEDEEPSIRERAVFGLWESEDRRTIPKLIKRLESDYEDTVRAAAALGLGNFSELACTNKLVQRDAERVYQALLSSLEDEDEPVEVRRRALESVGPFLTDEVRDWINWGYKSGDPFLRQSALNAMGRSCDESWLPLVLIEMDGDDPAIRFEAATAAGELGGVEALPRLSELVDDTDSEVAMAAMRAIGAIGGPQAKKILGALSTDGEADQLKEAASDALETIEGEDSDFSMLAHEEE